MRILNWMQNKLNVGQKNKRQTEGLKCQPNIESCNEEFRDWPHAVLLAIGTFGTHQSEKDSDSHIDPSDDSHPSQPFPDFADQEEQEDMKNFQKELRKLLSVRPMDSGDEESREDHSDLLIDKFLNCASSLKVDRTAACEKSRSEQNWDSEEEGEEDNDKDYYSKNASIILNKAKEMYMDKSSRMRGRSMAFLLKNMFVCQGGFEPAPSIRQPISESRMEKFLREMLRKKLMSRRSASPSARKYLANKNTRRRAESDDEEEKAEEGGSKWVKTDSDFIVLEI